MGRMQVAPTVNEATRRLPIGDRSTLREVLDGADVPTLLMVYVHLTGDVDVLDRFAPHIRPVMLGGVQIPHTLAADLRARLFDVLTQCPPLNLAGPSPRLMHKMMSVYVGEPVAEEFLPLLLEQAGFTGPQGIDLSLRQSPPQGFKVLVIGAGLTGINAGVRLAEAGYDYEIIERNDEVGGTWYHTRYPGLAVDTPSHFYSYSFELNANWTHWFSRGQENQDYLVHCARKFGVRDHVTFNTEVTSCVWDEAAMKWTVGLRANDDTTSTRIVDVVVCAVGFNNRPKDITIPGYGAFRGASMHTAKWDDGIRLEGKRIAVIGTGASAMQVAPAMAQIASKLTVFQRSKHWVMPIPILNERVPETLKWAMREIPHYGQWFRLHTYWNASDGLYQNVVMDPDWTMPEVSASAANEGIRQFLLHYIDQELADRPDLKPKVTPDYPPGGKRYCMDNGWFKMLKCDHVELETSGIERIVENGILTKEGRLIELDVIIFATGYVLEEMLAPMHIAGRGGVTIRQLWGKDDPRAHLGIVVPGFPNYFVTSGPNSAPNHGAGVNILAEAQINFVISCLDLLHARKAKSIEPTQAACQAYNDKLDAQLKQMVWGHPRVKSYYQNSKGRLYLSSPWRLVDYWTMLRAPNPAEFTLR